MDLRGNKVRDVLRNLAHVRDAEAGSDNIRALLYVPGGAMRGANSAGLALALQKTGFGRVFKTAIGVSSGSAVVPYFLAGPEQTKAGCRLYYERIPKYIHPGIKYAGRMIDVPGIQKELRCGLYALDVDAVNLSETDFYIGVVKHDNGRYDLLDAKAHNMIDLMGASMAIPGISLGKHHIDGIRYIDGGFYSYPLKYFIDEFAPTDILVLSNSTFEERNSGNILHSLMDVYTRMKYSSKTRGEIRNNRLESIDVGTWPNVNIGIMWSPDTGIDGMTTDSNALKNAIEIACDHAEDILAGL